MQIGFGSSLKYILRSDETEWMSSKTDRSSASRGIRSSSKATLKCVAKKEIGIVSFNPHTSLFLSVSPESLNVGGDSAQPVDSVDYPMAFNEVGTMYQNFGH